ncbi:hypothetical protein PORY_001205 [Pneumocystis oryctolagi]|uniref:Uncharacterized protein n=1 Tax=Pneumocystis oryctolagi TaxID=42067 RepID=A0ACB7CD21_9ASCO|nr:hypothetical protein PORY_001205 [Pneumocystis oryctolagi]
MNHRRKTSRYQLGSSSSKYTVSSGKDVPLNDDVEEKQQRKKERSKQDEKNRHVLMTPYKQVKSKRTDTPSTSDKTEMSFSGSTPVPKVPVLANFEEWMKMATDNKINATNSWNFALIDYFHEMSFLRDGDGINFQKASCTLDGCVKIYTSRVDSAATETGKLLSGLTCGDSSKVQEKNVSSDENINIEFEKPKKSKNKSEVTLVKDFSALQVKKFDLEFSVNPIFKKILADFDEGGAKGLLLNHLFIDYRGKIILDADDAIHDEIESTYYENIEDIDLSSLQEKFIPIMSNLDNNEVCPTLKNFNFEINPSLSISSLKVFEDSNEENGKFLVDDNVLIDDGGFGDDDIDNNPIPMITEENELNFQEHNSWGEDSVLKKLEKHDEKIDLLKVWSGNDFNITIDDSEDKVFEYFDQVLKRNWAGPEHWKIQRLRKEKVDINEPKKQREKKEPFLINFFDEEPIDFQTLFSYGGTNIYLPKTQWASKTRNLLPDDIYFNSKQLLHFFIKPKLKIFGKYTNSLDVNTNVDFKIADNNNNEYNKEQLTYDASFFDDNHDIDIAEDQDVCDNDKSVDTKNEIYLNEDEPKADNECFNPFTTTFKTRTDQLNYARITKRVNVKQLKENIWAELKFENMNKDHISYSTPKKTERKFTDVVKGLKNVYSKKEMDDISTSFCFICLLHLANEKGLIIENNEDLTELTIMLDTTIDST